jgi:hypothetical protein
VVVLPPPLVSVPTTSPVRACVRRDEAGFGVVGGDGFGVVAVEDALDSEHGDGGEGDDHDQEFNECGLCASNSPLFRARAGV